MSRVYDCWERLVAATLKREELRRIALCPSFDSVSSSDFSSRFSFHDGNPRGLTELSYEELKEKTDNFGLKAVIGDGPCGRVYFAHLNNGKKVAVRKLPSDLDDADFSTHVSLLSRLKHENVVEFVGYCMDRGVRILAYEYATMGSLEDILHGRKVTSIQPTSPILDWMQRVRIAVDVARGLQYLHDKAQPSVIHYNVQSSNVLLFEDYNAKIADLILYQSYPKPPLNTVDELYYVVPPTLSPYFAPESARGAPLTEKSDIYSFGVVLLELLTGRMPVDRAMPRGKQNLVTWATPRLTEDKVKQCVDPKLKGEYLQKGAAKLASVAALCVQYRADF